MSAVASPLAPQKPERSPHFLLGRRVEKRNIPILFDMKRRRDARAFARLDIVKTAGPIAAWHARPGPIVEVILKGARSKICVEISMPGPAPVPAVQLDVNSTSWRKGPPDMRPVRFKGHLPIGHSAWDDAHRAFDPLGMGG